jgi:uncharacterized membrane protein
MHSLRFPLMSALAFLAFLLAAPKVQAAAAVKACNQSSVGAWVGFGYYANDTVKWVTVGWWWADPNGCTELVRLPAAVEDVYVYANSQGDDVEWQGTKSLCVSMDRYFQYDDAEARACSTTRPFRKYTVGATDSLNVNLRDEDSVRVAYNFTLCNETDEYVSVAIGNAPAGDKGLSSDGWYGVERGQCATFIRRGRSDYGYFYAQTAGRQLVWYGQLPLCAQYHEAFALANADSVACNDGDSERLPFVKTQLAKGRGRYDLKASSAHAFKYTLNVCNRYSEDIYVAIAHLDGIWMNGIVARGFWRLRPGECKLVDSVATTPVYLYAETRAGDKVWGGTELTGCVRSEAFTFPSVNRLACNGSGKRRAGFMIWDVSEGANVYRFE